MGDRHGPDRWRRAVAISLLVGCGAVLGAHAAHGLRVTLDLVDGRWRADAEQASRRLSCLERQLDAAIPADSRVSVDAALGDDLWQRALELTWQRATPVRPGEPADLTLTAAPGNPTEPCDGAVVSVRPGMLPATSPTAPTPEPEAS
jgi:hypothetical protein